MSRTANHDVVHEPDGARGPDLLTRWTTGPFGEGPTVELVDDIGGQRSTWDAVGHRWPTTT